MKALLSALSLMILSGCATFSSVYPYRVVTDQCNCEEYRTHDKEYSVVYIFRARYTMQNGINPAIDIEFINNSEDTLFLDPGTATISSRTVSYQYNDKPVPLPELVVLPFHSDVVRVTGNDISGVDDWNKIAGEQLTLTVQGLRLGGNLLSSQRIVFVPDNPKMKR